MALEGGKMVVDAELLNDVTEQMGGGGEPFSEIQDRDLGPAAELFATVQEGLTDATEIAGAVGTKTLIASEQGVTAVANQVKAAGKTTAEAIQGTLAKKAEEQDL